jgi:N-dimethylarginine dimethylaminohydrolase
MRHTAHSDIGKIKSLFIKNAKQAFVSDSRLNQDWKSLNYLAKPDFRLAVEEYESFQSILQSMGAKIYFLPENDLVNMDSIFCRDASISTEGGMILCNMGKPGRVHEPGAQKIAFETEGLAVLGSILAPGTLEGGDVAWLDSQTLAVGHTYRSNEEGIRQLTELLNPLGVKVITVPLPHYKGPSDVFHLMSILSPVDQDLAVIYSPLMPIGFRNTLLERGFQLVEVPEEEFDTMGCNVLALEPRVCLMVAGNPKTKKALEAAGCQVKVYRGEEISQKGGGGPTCLTRPVDRYV